MSVPGNARLGRVMEALGLSAVALAAEVGISNSLVSRWQKGLRPLPAKGQAAGRVAAALARLDAENRLDDLLAPYGSGEDKEKALRRYLAGEDTAGLPAPAEPTGVPYSGEYEARQRVLLGARGFRKAALLMLETLSLLPPGRKVTVCAHGGYELWHGSPAFGVQFLQKMVGAVRRGARFTLVSRNAEGFDGSHALSVFWLAIQLKGIVRSRYYEGQAPPEYFVASIPGCWSARVERDDTAEDGLVSTLYTDPRNTRRDEAHCADILARSIPAGQFGFLRRPAGDEEYRQLWRPGPLPAHGAPGEQEPDGSFCAICRVPGFGVMTQKEWARLSGKDAPPLPDWLFSSDGRFAPGPHRVILCREDVQEGLAKTRRRSELLGAVLNRKVYLSRRMLAAQLKRLLQAMNENPDFEVALMPRSAFRKLELEFVYWTGGAAVGWLQDVSDSLLATDALTCDSFAHAAAQVWAKLHKGWKRKKTVKATLRKWLAGEGLDEHELDSASVLNWDVLPGE